LDPAAPSGALSGPPLEAGSAGRRHCRATAQPSSPSLVVSRRAARVLVSGGELNSHHVEQKGKDQDHQEAPPARNIQCIRHV